jgi:hypothetical protein
MLVVLPLERLARHGRGRAAPTSTAAG